MAASIQFNFLEQHEFDHDMQSDFNVALGQFELLAKEHIKNNEAIGLYLLDKIKEINVDSVVKTFELITIIRKLKYCQHEPLENYLKSKFDGRNLATITNFKIDKSVLFDLLDSTKGRVFGAFVKGAFLRIIDNYLDCILMGRCFNIFWPYHNKDTGLNAVDKLFRDYIKWEKSTRTPLTQSSKALQFQYQKFQIWYNSVISKSNRLKTMGYEMPAFRALITEKVREIDRLFIPRIVGCAFFTSRTQHIRCAEAIMPLIIFLKRPQGVSYLAKDDYTEDDIKDHGPYGKYCLLKLRDLVK